MSNLDRRQFIAGAVAATAAAAIPAVSSADFIADVDMGSVKDCALIVMNDMRVKSITQFENLSADIALENDLGAAASFSTDDPDIIEQFQRFFSENRLLTFEKRFEQQQHDEHVERYYDYALDDRSIHEEDR